MAGEIERFVSPSIAFEVKPTKRFHFQNDLISSNHTHIIMEDYLSGELNEDAIINLLLSDDKQLKALRYLEQHFQKSSKDFAFHDKHSLFKGFARALSESNLKIAVQCTKLLSKIIPQLGIDVDSYILKILPLVINNVGNQSIPLQKESIQMLYVYMKHSLDVDKIFRLIAHQGIQHDNPRIRQQIIRCFPTLLFSEFKHEDFFDIINCLAANLSENVIDQEIVLQVLNKMNDFLGKDMFTKYVNRLPSALRHNYYKCMVSSASKSSAATINSNQTVSFNKAVEDSHDKSISKYPLALIEKSTIDHKYGGNFAKSGHFDTIPSRRRHHHNVYSSFGTMASLDGFSKSEHSSFELSFIPSYIIEQMSSSEHSARLEAVEALREVLASLKETALIKENMVPLLSLLQPVFDDKNYRVACGALRAFSVMISKIGPEINNFVKLFVFAISRKLGNVKDSVRSECYKVLLQIMNLVGRQKVLNLFWEKLSHKQYKVREDFICVVIATLLTSMKSKNYNDFDFDLICNHIAACLTDSQQVVRQAALECISVLGHILGTTNKKILSAIDSVELKHDNASGIMSAVHARLLRRQLPRLNENMLVEYAVFSPPPASLTSPLGADLQWIYSAEKPKKANTNKNSIHASQEKNRKYLPIENSYKPKENPGADIDLFRQARRHLSAGRYRQFPWASHDELTSSKHPTSAPIENGLKPTPSQPPFLPRSTWGPESESSSTLQSNKSSGLDLSKNGPSYQELYQRKKEAQALKHHSNSNSLSGQISRTDSGYQPSFGSKAFSASSSNTHSQNIQNPISLSNSCPSSFLNKHLPAQPRRLKKKVALAIEDLPHSSANGSEESDSPIRLKPALARSASKRRDNALLASKEFHKSENSSEIAPIKLKNASASPRFDRLVASITSEPNRPAIKTVTSHVNDDDNIEGYTPSTLQQKSSKTTRYEVSSRVSFPSSENLSQMPSKESLLQEDKKFITDSLKVRPSVKPIVASSFTPAQHRSYEETAEFQLNALNSIRRSAQNKRERMRSQPGSDDGFSSSFSEFSTPILSKIPANVSQQSQYDVLPTTRSSSQPVTSTELVTSATADTPTFKYNPITGVTFDSKKVDSNVSVVGVRYPGQSSSNSQLGILSNDSRSPNSSSTTFGTSSNVNFSNKLSLTDGENEKHKSSKNTIQGEAVLSKSPDIPTNRIFNVQGKGVFMSPSNSSLLSGNDPNGSSSHAKEDNLYKPTAGDRSTSKEQNKIFDGVFGIGVKNPSSTFQDMQSRGVSDVQVSLSASLKERREKHKEVVLSKNTHSLTRTLFPDDNLALQSQSDFKFDSTDDFVSFSDSLNRKKSIDSRIKPSNKAALRSMDSSRKSVFESVSGPSYKSGPGPPVNALAPLDHPEKNLVDAIQAMNSANSEEWEVVTQAMYTIRRLTAHHPHLVSPRFHDVITLLNKYVPSLRSQVSKASAQAITDLYMNLKKPTVDTDVDATIRTLLSEHGKQMSFIKDETDKTLQAIVDVASTNKALNALLNVGLRHKNKGIRNTAAKFCARLVTKMGPGKALCGVKDTTERLLEAISVFINDSSPDVRHYGRYIINELMVHDDFNRCLDRCLSLNAAQEVKTAATNIKQRGLGSLSSVGGRKGGSGRSRNEISVGSSKSSAIVERDSPSNSSHSRRKGTVVKVFNEQEQEELKNLCNDLSSGSLNERKLAIETLLEKLQSDRRFVEENIVKIMGSYIMMLTTAQTKLNSIALESLPHLIMDLHPHFRDVTPQLVPALLKLISSKQHCDLAQENINCMVKCIEPLWIIQHFANSAMYGNANTKPTALNVLTKLVISVARKKPQVVERQVLPVFWNLLSNQAYFGNPQLRKEAISLANVLYDVFGMKLIEMSESKNLSAKTKDILDLNAS